MTVQTSSAQLREYFPVNPLHPVNMDKDVAAAVNCGGELVMEPAALNALRSNPNLRIVDVRSADQCPDGHIPGAVLLDQRQLYRRDGDTQGLLPHPDEISRILENIGIAPHHFVVAYDDGPGVDAARLLWTLDAIGHTGFALLNGGFAAWDFLEMEVADSPFSPVTGRYPVDDIVRGHADIHDVFMSLDEPGTVLVDTRSRAEFDGEDVRAKSGGHIPGAVHFDWETAVDMMDDGRLRSTDELRHLLRGLGITPDKRIVVYCQSNRRSAHTYLVLKWLGFQNVEAYAGSWSEWGNLD